jgi:hypothetical protein
MQPMSFDSAIAGIKREAVAVTVLDDALSL